MDFPGFFMLGLWADGFLGALFTRSVWFTVTIFSLYHFIFSWYMGAIVAGELLFHHVVTTLALTTIGAIVGVSYAWALRLPQLFPTEVFFPGQRKLKRGKTVTEVILSHTSFGNLVFPLSLLTAIGGVFYIVKLTPGILGTPIDSPEFLALGIVLLIVGALVFLAIVIDSAWPHSPFPGSKLLYFDSERYPSYLALFYGLVLVLLLAPNTIIDFLSDEFPVWPTGVALAVILVLYLVLYAILKASSPLALMFDERGRERRFTAFVVVTALVHIVTGLVFWGVDVITESDPQILFVILSSVSVVWVLASFPFAWYIVPSYISQRRRVLAEKSLTK